ncbi:hypothetical protein [Niabella soli]|uniref:Uncharacterized protein n=1 Tax=Niabella soli DSM 19437 TaxID=929713 RepID=W0EVH4_9BACT|nr:hypothetical protein [Niabella soli]AHF14805.1 hypothetical protein NIASO_05685 [Niabella soli DSM 19437]
MKKLFTLAVFISGLAIAQVARAQVSVNINIGSQPQWGPSGYNYARYYYIPEINAYYDVTSRTYIFQNGRRWVTKRSLPGRYRNFDLYRTYKVVVNSDRPWQNNAVHIRNYSRYRTNYSQVNIRDYNVRHDNRGNNRYNDHQNGRHDRDRRNDHRR